MRDAFAPQAVDDGLGARDHRDLISVHMRFRS